MIAKYPPEGGTWDKAGEAVDVEQAFDCSHADIMTEFWSRARRIFSGFLQGIRTLKGKSHPLKITKSHKLHVYAALVLILHDSAQVVHVSGQAIHAMHHHGIAFPCI